MLYGTTAFGANGFIPFSYSGSGTVFALKTDGTSFTTLHYFAANSDGASPFGGLTLSGSTLYGTTAYGGSSDKGTVFKVSTDGTGFMTLYNFTATYRDMSMGNINGDGANPFGGVTLSGNTLYGTANDAVNFGRGTVFSISLPLNPLVLTIIRSGSDIILMWPTNATGYTLQSTTNLFAPVWSTNLRSSVVVNGQNTVTNPIAGTQQFYRLSQ